MPDNYKALIRAVLLAPYDDLPRLVLADWLEEHEQAEWAREVRSAIHSKEAVEVEIPGYGMAQVTGTSRRGFVESILIRCDDYFDRLPDLFKAHPNTAV
jgi:uncharacterized protein (TIGR02996 family)